MATHQTDKVTNRDVMALNHLSSVTPRRCFGPNVRRVHRNGGARGYCAPFIVGLSAEPPLEQASGVPEPPGRKWSCSNLGSLFLSQHLVQQNLGPPIDLVDNRSHILD